MSAAGLRISNINPKDCFSDRDFGRLMPDIRVFGPGIMEGFVQLKDLDKDILIDVTVRNPLVSSYTEDGAYTQKVKKYEAACTTYSYVFVPLVFEACGKLHPRTIQFLSVLYDRISAKEDTWGFHNTASYWNRRLSAALHRSNTIATTQGFGAIFSRLNGIECLADEGNYPSTYARQLFADQHLSPCAAL